MGVPESPKYRSVHAGLPPRLRKPLWEGSVQTGSNSGGVAQSKMAEQTYDKDGLIRCAVMN